MREIFSGLRLQDNDEGGHMVEQILAKKWNDRPLNTLKNK